ncbi:MAG: hypothetical protein IJS90_01945 [Clostridia bacterium]|nr:hypothetical protein [Clostridia bacterium]
MENEKRRFIKSSKNPIYGSSETGTLFDVYVTKQPGGGLRMDFSWRTNDTAAVVFSDDGENWTPPRSTLFPLPSSGWEDLINRNCVLKIGNKYKMWYTGQARGHSYIGAAESDDGLSFTRIGSEPVLFPERPWEGASVMNPCVLYENGIYRMWYSAGETYEPNVIAYAESADGITWRKSPINPIFVNAPYNEYEKERIGGCQVLPHGELGYLMFYIGYRDINTACICCAYSENGVTQFHRCKLNPLVSPSPGEWDKDSCYKPSALYDKDKDLWRIWYNGRSGNKEFIGLASMRGDFTKADFN